MHKQPIAAWEDAEFATEAHDLTGTTFVAHVRYATTGSHDVVNTHPFLQDDRIFAHNGVVEGLDVLDERLRELGTADLVLGQTDSERVFALITASIRARGGDVHRRSGRRHGLAGRTTCRSTRSTCCSARPPTCGHCATRSPNELYVSDRRKTPSDHRFHLRTNRIRADSDHLRSRPSVVFATEPMDDDPRWRLFEPGELVHVDSALQITSDLVLPDPPRHQLRPEDLNAAAQAAQHISPT